MKLRAFTILCVLAGIFAAGCGSARQGTAKGGKTRTNKGCNCGF